MREADSRRISRASSIACSSAIFTPSGNCSSACSSVSASISNTRGSTPAGVSNCVCPENSTAREASGDPSTLTGVRRRIVPALRSVNISSLYSSAGSSLTSGRSFCAAMSVHLRFTTPRPILHRRSNNPRKIGAATVPPQGRAGGAGRGCRAATKGRSASRMSSAESRAGCTHFSRWPSRDRGSPS